MLHLKDKIRRKIWTINADITKPKNIERRNFWKLFDNIIDSCTADYLSLHPKLRLKEEEEEETK